MDINWLYYGISWLISIIVKSRKEIFEQIKASKFLFGKDIINLYIYEKMIYIDSIIANQFTKDYCPNFKLKINILYKYNML